MILYGTLLFYLLLVIVSAVFFWWKRSGHPHHVDSFVFPLKNPLAFGQRKGKVSRFITHFECPECGFETEEHKVHCPRCKAEGKSVHMEARTFVLQP
ncbi:MAG TPA: hypothetical protein ENJ69_03230 [Bacteroidetes bacterium]|nr:hypothetical protein [Bacteroidota bacterium]